MMTFLAVRLTIRSGCAVCRLIDTFHCVIGPASVWADDGPCTTSFASAAMGGQGDTAQVALGVF